MKDKEENILEEDKKEEEISLSQKGGLYSKIPKNEKSIKSVTIIVILFGFAFVGLLIVGIVLQC